MSDSDSTSPTTVVNPVTPGPRKGLFGRAIDSFKPPIGQNGFTPERTKAAVYPKNAGMDPEKGQKPDGVKTTVQGVSDDDEAYDDNGGLHRALGGRHLQMIALGGSIGTGLFIGSGGAFNSGGPGSVLIGFSLVGIMLFTVVNALGELACTFPIQGSFSIYATRFIHPSWGFAMGWNYALQWIVTLPTELSAAVLVIKYWDTSTSPAVWISLLLGWVFLVNMLGVRGYGEAEVVYSMIKVIAILGFIILAIVINAGGAPDHHYYGAHTWYDPGAFNNGFKGFCSVFVTAAFAFSGTELVGLAAAETANPRKTLPTATKQVFWRVTFFYIVSLLLVGFLVPYNDPNLLNGSGAAASPFVIAIKNARIKALPSIFNAVILISVLSVGNSATFATSRTLTALAGYRQAPKFLMYVDREGRPLFSLLIVIVFGCLGYINLSSSSSTVFNWLLAIGGLSVLFTWASICFAHIRFRQAWKAQGHTVEELPFRAAFGVWGSWFGGLFNVLILVATFYVAVWPIGLQPNANSFFLSYLAAPIILVTFIAHLLWKRPGLLHPSSMDIDTGRSNFPSLETLRAERAEVASKPFFGRWFSYLC
ncbi:glyceraldehyde-3-phosphate dehydrogenase 1 [Tulasnella sp. 332]|nr:glyceraldehyde-3-phosphate dehydrogenase 1 [Tulasnella sp. 332]